MVRLLLMIAIVTSLPCAAQSQGAAKPVEHIVPTNDQALRRATSEKYCKDRGIPVYKNPYALFTEPEEKVSIRDKNAVVNRALALFYISQKGDGTEKKTLDSVYKLYSIASKLSPQEKIFVAAKNPDKQLMINASWRYESLHVLLSFPNQACPVEEDLQIIADLTETAFRERAKLRSKKEILDQADLIIRLHWACVDARVKNQPAPAGLENGVVYERHYTLNWLINYLNQSWDAVTTDT